MNLDGITSVYPSWGLWQCLFQPGKSEVCCTILDAVVSSGRNSIFSDKFKSFWHICLSCHLPNDPLTSENLWTPQPFLKETKHPLSCSQQIKREKKRPKNTTPLPHNNGCILNLLVWFSKQYHFFFYHSLYLIELSLETVISFVNFPFVRLVPS